MALRVIVPAAVPFRLIGWHLELPCAPPELPCVVVVPEPLLGGEASANDAATPAAKSASRGMKRFMRGSPLGGCGVSSGKTHRQPGSCALPLQPLERGTDPVWGSV